MHSSTFILLIFVVASIILSIILDIYMKSFSFVTVIGYIIAILIYYIMLLDQECIHSEGSCTIWGWIRATLIMLFFILLLVLKAYFIYVYSRSKKEETKSEK
jgi:membrane-bound ClpP family serine protease